MGCSGNPQAVVWPLGSPQSRRMWVPGSTTLDRGFQLWHRPCPVHTAAFVTLSVLIRVQSIPWSGEAGGEREPSGMDGERTPPPQLSPSPRAGVWVKSLDFNGGIGLKSLNSARPHCGGVGGGERSAGGMGGLPALLWERGETSGVPHPAPAPQRPRRIQEFLRQGPAPRPPESSAGQGTGRWVTGASRPCAGTTGGAPVWGAGRCRGFPRWASPGALPTRGCAAHPGLLGLSDVSLHSCTIPGAGVKPGCRGLGSGCSERGCPGKAPGTRGRTAALPSGQSHGKGAVWKIQLLQPCSALVLLQKTQQFIADTCQRNVKLSSKTKILVIF